MITIDKTRLSEGMRKDLENYEDTKEDAIYWLGTGALKTTDEIITRLQSAKIVDVALSGLKTIDDWSISNNALTIIRSSTPAMSINNKYSSYALVENSSKMGTLRYPLCNSFAAKNILFSKKEFPLYKALIQRVQNAYKIKIVEQTNKDKLFSYKRTGKVIAKLKNASLGVVNLCKKVFKKNQFKTHPSYKGKMIINNNYTYGNGATYQISQHEKFTRIIDGIMAITVKNQSKKNKIQLSKNEMFASRLFAEILLSRAINYGDVESNVKVESSLTLQFSNVLAALNLTPEKLQDVSKLGMLSALDAIDRLGLNLEDIKLSVKNAGYAYAREPETIKDALLPKEVLSKEDVLVTEEQEEVVDAVETQEVNKDSDVTIQPEIEENYSKYSEVKNLEGVKTQTVMLSQLTAKRYIDRVVESSFKKIIDSSINQISTNQIKGGKKEKRLERQYNFVEHMLAYYNKNKDIEPDVLVEKIEQELSSTSADDNKYAHSLGQSFVELRNYILDEVFKGEKYIEKVEGKGVAKLVNEFVEEKFGKQLSAYATSSLKKAFVPIFKEIDANNFKPKKLVEHNTQEKE